MELKDEVLKKLLLYSLIFEHLSNLVAEAEKMKVWRYEQCNKYVKKKTSEYKERTTPKKEASLFLATMHQL